ncbi:MAG TPA: GNAT family N-acetyltransferase [Ignavibacteria bacterium]|mgnify:CR=1 FL=1|nr:GNAT family N-acetyltransferase [Ignavibacteria bacterium]HMQ98650.1 GNAT family N-acetyltransferase [Ignavibacteria bacterium]
MNTYIIETERLKLREFNSTDGELIFELLNSPGWLKNIGSRSIATIDDAVNYIEAKLQKSYRESGFGFYLVELKSTGEKTGMCGLVKRDGLDDIDIGFALLPQYENNGYAFESSEAVISYAKNKLKIKTLAAITMPSNVTSIKLLEKLGMKFDKKINIPGDPEELFLYRMELVDQ